MNRTRMYVCFLLLAVLMVTACTLEGDLDEVRNKAGIWNDNYDPYNPYDPYYPNTLAAPSGVTASAYSSSSIYISWNPVSGADFYNVYRSSSASGYYSYIGAVESTIFYDYNVYSNTTYYYKVSAAVNNYAVNGYVESSQSAYASATTYY